jgi:hypothetical protein
VTRGVETENEDKKMNLSCAGILAEFANVDPSDALQIDKFKKKNAEFFPETWWPEKRLEYPATLVKSGYAGPDWQGYQKVVREAWIEGFPLDLTIRSVTLPGFLLQHATVYNYQRAVMLLHVQPWRASFCPKCGSRFVRAKPGDRFCGKICAGSHRKQYQHELYLKDGKKWRLKANKGSSKKRNKQR